MKRHGFLFTLIAILVIIGCDNKKPTWSNKIKERLPDVQTTGQDNTSPGPLTIDSLIYTPVLLNIQESWTKLDEGLHYAELTSPIKCNLGDSKISIVKISPLHYNFQLITSKESGETNKTAPEWAKSRKLVGVFNAGMYMMDHKTNVGYMKAGGFVNNDKFNKEYNTITAFDPILDSLPSFQLIDLQCQSQSLVNHYNSATQCIRMVDCNQKNCWSQQDRRWSMICVAEDKSGNVLFAFTRSPYSVHDFIEILFNLKIAPGLNIKKAMYLEGGPEASFYLNTGSFEVAKMGSYETGFNENDDNHEFWPIPNVIGISKK